MPVNLQPWGGKGGGAQKKPRFNVMGALPASVMPLPGEPAPSNLMLRIIRGDRQLNNRPGDVVHNHAGGQARIQYDGYSRTTKHHHVFRCMAASEPPNRKVQLQPFDRSLFTLNTKAGRGECSMRFCPSEAAQMAVHERQAYCERCALQLQSGLPCPWTSIEPCYWRMQGDHCPTCVGFEEVTDA